MVKPLPRVGVLSLHGDFACHRASLEPLGVETVRVSVPRDLEGVEALIMPGGETTTILRLLETTGLRKPVEAFVRDHPVLGTCAGLILLGRSTTELPHPTFGVLDAEVERNAYGRQVHSFSEEIEATMLDSRFLGVFIRAPRIRKFGREVEVIARRGTGGEPVGLRSGNLVGLCFHPELTSDLRLHRWFLSEVASFSIPLADSRLGEKATQGGSS